MWTQINLLLTLGERYIVKRGTLDYVCLPGHLMCFVNRQVLCYLKKKISLSLPALPIITRITAVLINPILFIVFVNISRPALEKYL